MKFDIKLINKQLYIIIEYIVIHFVKVDSTSILIASIVSKEADLIIFIFRTHIIIF